MVVGIDEEVDEAGAYAGAVDAEPVLARVRDLIRLGAQLIVVSLRNAWRNPANEQAVRRIVRERYPIHYLRSVPVQLGIEVVHDRDDHARTNSALLNAYIHAEMARVLFRAEDKLRARLRPAAADRACERRQRPRRQDHRAQHAALRTCGRGARRRGARRSCSAFLAWSARTWAAPASMSAS